MIWFTADEHYGHTNIIRFCSRPFTDVKEMNETLIAHHNEVVKDGDLVYHVGDFALMPTSRALVIWNRLHGRHIFIKGSHDRWSEENLPYLWEGFIGKQYVVLCHYAMRVWPRSHYNSWQLHGHSHGRLEPQGLQYDVGVDNNGFYPVSFGRIRDIMEARNG